jgi:ribosomal-protein-alanine N-acetyltransferase
MSTERMQVIRETPRLLLAKCTSEDVALLHPITSDAPTMSFWPAPFTLEQSAEWIARSIRSYKEHGFGRYGALLKYSGEFIGCAGFFRTTVNDKLENDLGYIIAKKHWNKGYATEAAKACIEMAKEKSWFDRIVVQMSHDNIASRRVAEHLGAKLETTFVNPKNRDILTNLFVLNI